MPVEFGVAVVALLGSLGAAALAWIHAIRTARLSGSFQIQLEQLRLDAQRKVRALELANSEAAPVEEALDVAWRDMQVAKDAIANMLFARQSEVPLHFADLLSAAKDLDAHYTLHASRLPKTARDAWHKAKGTLLALTRSADGASAAAVDSSALSDTRMSLTGYQAVLLLEKASLRTQLLQQISELL